MKYYGIFKLQRDLKKDKLYCRVTIPSEWLKENNLLDDLKNNKKIYVKISGCKGKLIIELFNK